MKICPICQQSIAVYSGPKNSPFLLLTDSPDKDDMKSGKVMTGKMAGILGNELGKRGIDISGCRKGSFWRHAPNKDQGCLDEGFAKVVKESVGRKAIFLFGAECTKFFTGYGVLDISGLEVSSKYFSCPVICSVSPGLLLRDGAGIGEIRFAIKKFSELVAEYL